MVAGICSFAFRASMTSVWADATVIQSLVHWGLASTVASNGHVNLQNTKGGNTHVEFEEP